jgi:uncharacterized SAM-binding protein YcdF (DUF218 family)
VIRRLGTLLLVGVAIALVAAAWTSFRIWDVGNRDDAGHADAIVVLGAAQYNGRPSAILRSRLDHALELFEAGRAPFLVVTGGKAQGDRTTEAASARTYALARGVPDRAILVEDEGRTTQDSLRGVATLLREHDLSSAIFVSDRTHMLRVLRIAADEGVVALGSPTSTSPSDANLANRFEATIHEIGGLATYFVLGQTP